MEDQSEQINIDTPHMESNSFSSKESYDSSLPDLIDIGCTSPILDDFDDELCMELEEVGKELDLYRSESNSVSDSGERKGDFSFQVTRDSALSSLRGFSPLESERPHSTSLCTTKTKKVETQSVTKEEWEAMSPSAMNNKAAKEVSKEEYECRLKALISQKASLVSKLKVMVSYQKSLALEKDSMLKNCDGDICKLSENLCKNLTQSKEVDVRIQTLNAQITLTRKTISILKNKKHLLHTKKYINHSDDNSVIHKKYLIQTQSKELSDSPTKPNDKSNGISIDYIVKTSPEEGEKVFTAKTKNVPSDDQSYVRQDTVPHTVSPITSPPPSEEGNTTECQVKKTNVCEAKKSDCEVVEKLVSKLAMHPSTKNLNTLWCKSCNLFFTSIFGYIRHLELPEHLDKEQKGEEFLHKLLGPSRKVDEDKDRGNTQEAFGLEFLRSTRLIYCSLCDCPLITEEDSARHTQSLQHTKKYKEYILKNSRKELAFQKAKMVAFSDYCKRRKASLSDKKQITEKDEDQNKEGIVKIDKNKTQMEDRVTNGNPITNQITENDENFNKMSKGIVDKTKFQENRLSISNPVKKQIIEKDENHNKKVNSKVSKSKTLQKDGASCGDSTKKKMRNGKDENHIKKVIGKLDENTIVGKLSGSYESLKAKSIHKKKPWLQNENIASHLHDKEGKKLSKENLLMHQNLNVTVSNEKNGVKRHVKQIFEHPAISKRRKLVN